MHEISDKDIFSIIIDHKIYFELKIAVDNVYASGLFINIAKKKSLVYLKILKSAMTQEAENLI